MLQRLRNRAKEQKGFTLIELLVVVIIIGLLAAIAIPAFLGQRDKANDASAKSLVRNGQTAVEAAYADTQDYATITPAMLAAIEPNIAFDAANNDAALNQVSFVGNAAGFTLTSRSKSGFVYTLKKDTAATPAVTRTYVDKAGVACTVNATTKSCW